MTPEEVVAACREAGVRLVRFLYCDNGGVVRGKSTHVDRLADRMHGGITVRRSEWEAYSAVAEDGRTGTTS